MKALSFADSDVYYTSDG